MNRGWRFRQIARQHGAEDRLFGPRWAGSASPAGQGGHASGQGSGQTKPLTTKAGQAGEGGQGTETAAAENTRTRVRVPPGEKPPVIPVRVHGPHIYPDQTDQPDQASNGAGFSRSGHSPSAQTTLTNWADLDAWCARIGAAGVVDNRRVVLREWTGAAGGWSDAAAVHLPVGLPSGLALTTLKAHARSLGLVVHEDPDDPAHLQWLRGVQ